jgi:hypothetical protein
MHCEFGGFLSFGSSELANFKFPINVEKTTSHAHPALLVIYPRTFRPTYVQLTDRKSIDLTSGVVTFTYTYVAATEDIIVLHNVT